MYELGKKHEIFGAGLLKTIVIQGRPEKMPELEKDESVIGSLHMGSLYERLYVCDEGLQDMQTIYEAYSQGQGTRLTWYRASDVGFIGPAERQI